MIYFDADAVLRAARGLWEALAPGGYLLSETSERQTPLAEAVFTASGLTVRVATSAELAATVVIGRRPARTGPPAVQ